ncbi:MAG: hypothetical protein COB04_13130 [Gammaproteobacteria bacterium]|nr:MAG: hypothetical protein COB04_13130 [Gammaproteobacteria bacterium]
MHKRGKADQAKVKVVYLEVEFALSECNTHSNISRLLKDKLRRIPLNQFLSLLTLAASVDISPG